MTLKKKSLECGHKMKYRCAQNEIISMNLISMLVSKRKTNLLQVN